MPNCDLGCRERVLTSIRSSRLEAISLLCTDIKLQEQLGKCIFSVCPFSDLKLAIDNFTKLCNGYPQQTRCEQIIRTTITMSLLTLFFISLRLKSRWFDQKHLWLDDWIAFVVFALIAGSAVLLIIIAKAGMGEHLWNSNVDSYAMIGKVFYSGDSKMERLTCLDAHYLRGLLQYYSISNENLNFGFLSPRLRE